MPARRSAVWLVAVLLACGLNASAITISNVFDVGSAPGNAVGGGNLDTLFRTAASWWETAIQDSYTVTVYYAWAPLSGGTLAQHLLTGQGGTPNRETAGYIEFDNDGSNPFFLDPTPLDNLEFGVFTASAQNLGGGSLNVGRVWTEAQGLAADHYDLLSVAYHEIGHALGLSSANSSFQAESADNDVDVAAPLPFAGSTIPLVGAHINIGSALMYPTYSSGVRRFATAADILANAQISSNSSVNLNPVELTPLDSTNSFTLRIIDSATNAGGAFALGLNGPSNVMIITNGGSLTATASTIGHQNIASNNTAWVKSAGSVWSNSGSLLVGEFGANNQLLITNGGHVFSAGGFVGSGSTSSNNLALISGGGSLWSNTSMLVVGATGSFNRLTITDGAMAWSATGSIGSTSASISNRVLVTGSGSLWQSGSIIAGDAGRESQLIVTNGGSVLSTNVVIGASTTSTNNLVKVSAGSLFVTNATGDAALHVRRGRLEINSSTVTVDRLVATNGLNSVLNFNSGTLATMNTAISNSLSFHVGDGIGLATLDLLGGSHSFANGLLLSSNANLVGSGTIIGSVTNFGDISPGHSIGVLAITDDLVLMDSSVLDMEIGGPNAGEYDEVNVTGLLTAGGWLNVSFTNGYAPAKGAKFDLFGFGAETGAFAGITLPTFQYAGTDWDTSHLAALASDPLSGTLIFIPEPSTAVLLLLGLGRMCITRKRLKPRVR